MTKQADWVNNFILPLLVAAIIGVVGLLWVFAPHWFARKPNPGPAARPQVGNAQALQAMANDLAAASPEDRPHYRYATLVHLHNQRGVSAEELESVRSDLQAVAKTLARDGRTPALPVDPQGLILRIDLRDLGWNSDPDWRRVLASHPYSLDHANSKDAELKEAQLAVQKHTGETIAHVRADWLIGFLARPPLTDAIKQRIDAYPEQSLDLDQAAIDLGLMGSEAVRSQLAREGYLREEFGLAPLAEGKTIRRAWWESEKVGTSPFQELSRVLDLGKPFRVR